MALTKKQISREGFSTEEVFNKVLHEAIGYVDSQEMLERCIASLNRLLKNKFRVTYFFKRFSIVL